VPLLQGIARGECGLADSVPRTERAAELVKAIGGKERILLDRVVGAAGS
jgi:hypothetical protein